MSKYRKWLSMRENFLGGLSTLGLARPQTLGIAGRGVQEKTHPHDDDTPQFGDDGESDLDMDMQGGDELMGSDSDPADLGGEADFDMVGNGGGLQTIDDLIALLQALKDSGGQLSGMVGGDDPGMGMGMDMDAGSGDADMPLPSKGGKGNPFASGDDADDSDDSMPSFLKDKKKDKGNPFGKKDDDGSEEDKFPSDVDDEDDDDDDDDSSVPAFVKEKGKEKDVAKENRDWLKSLTEGYTVPKSRPNTRDEFWASLRRHNHDPKKRYSSGLDEDYLIQARQQGHFDAPAGPGEVGFAPHAALGGWAGQRPQHFMRTEEKMAMDSGFKGGGGLDLQKNLGPLAKVAQDLLAAASDPGVDPGVKAKLMDTLQTIVMGGDAAGGGLGGGMGGDMDMGGDAGDMGMGGPPAGPGGMGGGAPTGPIGGPTPGGASPPPGQAGGGMGGAQNAAL